jgi:glyoxalase family protein
MISPMLGLHHVTAIVDDPQQNFDFYTLVLGLRLVKRTVNFDDPYTYHLYFGDEQGRPGTLVTFFPWPGGRRGGRGNGQISAISFAVPVGALERWEEHLRFHEIGFSAPEERHAGRTIALYDPAGLLLELVEVPAAEPPASATGPLPAEQAILGLLGVTLTVADLPASAGFLRDTLGFTALSVEESAARFQVGSGAAAGYIEVQGRPGQPRGHIAAGSVHHVAFRVADDAQQAAWSAQLQAQGVSVTDVRDRQYFRSIYFHEPAGIVFEIATDAPGFAIDEPLDQLGQKLMLPPWLEAKRTDIEWALPQLIADS